MSDKPNQLIGIEPTEKGQRAIERIKERFKVDSVPAPIEVLAGAENGIHDLYMNLNRQLAEGKVTEKVKLLVALGVAAATGSAKAVEFFTDAAIAAGWTREQALEAIAVANTCSIFNGYYRFRHQVPEDWKASFEAFKAPFNANTFVKSGLEQIEVEAICVAVSSANHCHVCVEGHVNKAKSLGMTEEQVDELIRAAAVAAAAGNIMSALNFQGSGAVTA